MTDYEILKKSEDMCHEIWKTQPLEPTEDGIGWIALQHYHMCDFEILNFHNCKNRRRLNKVVEKKCKEYLTSIGQERDECMCCCDHCIHDRYLTVSEKTDGLILNIATLGLDHRVIKAESDVDGENMEC